MKEHQKKLKKNLKGAAHFQENPKEANVASFQPPAQLFLDGLLEPGFLSNLGSIGKNPAIGNDPEQKKASLAELDAFAQQVVESANQAVNTVESNAQKCSGRCIQKCR